MMKKKTDRISTLNFKGGYDIDKAAYVSMFMDDLHKGIVPIYGSKLDSVNCYLEPTNADFERQLVKLLPSQMDRHWRDFNVAILGTIDYIANYLAHKGYCILELVEEVDLNDVVSHYLAPINSAEFKMDKKFFYQVYFNDFKNEQQLPDEVKVPIDKCFVIEFPKELGGRSKYLKFVEEFKSIEVQSPMMNFFDNPLANSFGYNMMAHQHQHDIEMWRKSKVFGWNHRTTNSKLFSGYYSIYRYLSFKKTKIILRDCIIRELTEVIKQLSEKFVGEKLILKIEGLTTIEQVEDKLSKWKSGELLPNEISEVH